MSIIHAAVGATAVRRPYGLLISLLFVLAVVLAVLMLAMAVGPAGGILPGDWLQVQ